MQDKLQALLDKIQKEGVAKGQDVAGAIIKDAEKKADRIVQEAEQEAAATRRQAREEADELKRNVESELRLSASQTISALRQQISKLITTKAVAEPIQQSFEDEPFVKELIETLLRNWQSNSNGTVNLRLLLPPDQQEQLEAYFSAKAKDLMNGELVIETDRKLENGFRIGPTDGGYVLSFTDADFETFFMDYLRPTTKRVLFEQQAETTRS